MVHIYMKVKVMLFLCTLFVVFGLDTFGFLESGRGHFFFGAGSDVCPFSETHDFEEFGWESECRGVSIE